MNADGTGQIRITNNLPSTVMRNNPILSPDGNKILFNLGYTIHYDDSDGSNPDSYLFGINIDGTRYNVLQYSDRQYFGEPKWSPDGTKIAISKTNYWESSYSDIDVINSDGTGLTHLVCWLDRNIDPQWSPDSTKIVYHSDDRMGPFGGLVVTNSDGSTPKYDYTQEEVAFDLTHPSEGYNDGSPTWSPDSRKIAFVSSRDGNEEIYVKNADGTGRTRLTKNTNSDYSPGWGPSTATSSITVKSPNGGESWKRGTSQTVTWDYTGTLGSTVKLVLVKGGIEVGTINSSVSIGTVGKGSYTWPINPSGTTGSDYTVSVQSISQPTIKDTSDNNFTVSPAGGTITPTITVTSPNGVEIWKRGTTQTVKWSYTGSPGSYVKIELLLGGTPVGTATYSTSLGSGGIGSYQWSISSGRAPGTNYRIRVTSVSQPTISDTSNGDFTITA